MSRCPPVKDANLVGKYPGFAKAGSSYSLGCLEKNGSKPQIINRMFWEEKIDRIKKQFSQDEFRVPFSDWSGIIKKMEASFVISSKPAYRYTNWCERLKDTVVLRKIANQAIPTAISTLDPGTNYWVVIVLGNASMAQQLVYDCKPAAMEQLAAIAPGDFYIGDKKYQWLVYFNGESNGKCGHFDQSRKFPDSSSISSQIPAPGGKIIHFLP